MFSKWSTTSFKPSEVRNSQVSGREGEEPQTGWKSLRIRSQSKHRSSAQADNPPKINTDKRTGIEANDEVELPTVNPLSPLSDPAGWFETKNGFEKDSEGGFFQFRTLSLSRDSSSRTNSQFSELQPELQSQQEYQHENRHANTLSSTPKIEKVPLRTYEKVDTLNSAPTKEILRAVDVIDRWEPSSSSRSSGDTTVLGDFDSRHRNSVPRNNWMVSDAPEEEFHNEEEIRDDETMCSVTEASDHGDINLDDTNSILKHHGKERRSVLEMFMELEICVDQLNQDAMDLENLERQLKAANKNALTIERPQIKPTQEIQRPETPVQKKELFEPISGYMTKLYQKGVFKSWKRRFFILAPDKLYYFRSHETTHETVGVIPITKTSDCYISSNSQLKDKFVFEIVSKDTSKSVFLYCDNLNEMRNWVKGIRKIILNQRSKAEELKSVKPDATPLDLTQTPSKLSSPSPSPSPTPNIAKSNALQSTVSMLHELNGNPPLSLSSVLKRASSLPVNSLPLTNKATLFPHGTHLRNSSNGNGSQDNPYVLPRTLSDDDIAHKRTGTGTRLNPGSPLRQDHAPELIVARRGSSSSLMTGHFRTPSLQGSMVDLQKTTAAVDAQKVNVLDPESPIESALALLDMIDSRTRRGSSTSLVSTTGSTYNN